MIIKEKADFKEILNFPFTEKRKADTDHTLEVVKNYLQSLDAWNPATEALLEAIEAQEGPILSTSYIDWYLAQTTWLPAQERANVTGLFRDSSNVYFPTQGVSKRTVAKADFMSHLFYHRESLGPKKIKALKTLFAMGMDEDTFRTLTDGMGLEAQVFEDLNTFFQFYSDVKEEVVTLGPDEVKVTWDEALVASYLNTPEGWDDRTDEDKFLNTPGRFGLTLKEIGEKIGWNFKYIDLKA